MVNLSEPQWVWARGRILERLTVTLAYGKLLKPDFYPILRNYGLVCNVLYYIDTLWSYWNNLLIQNFLELGKIRVSKVLRKLRSPVSRSRILPQDYKNIHDLCVLSYYMISPINFFWVSNGILVCFSSSLGSARKPRYRKNWTTTVVLFERVNPCSTAHLSMLLIAAWSRRSIDSTYNPVVKMTRSSTYRLLLTLCETVAVMLLIARAKRLQLRTLHCGTPCSCSR